MANPNKKKMVDIVQSASKPAPRKKLMTIEEDFKELDNNIGEKLDKNIEQFEKKEEEQFKKEEEIKNKRKFSWKTYALSGLFLILSGTAVYSAIEFLPKAKIKIITEKTEWSYIDSVTAGKDAAQISAEIFSARKNFNFSFAATGRKQVKKKASGKITIYNAYSSNSQPLIAGTRFSSSDGKIFRLTERIVVPGAQVIEGKIVSSSIEAKAEADQPGPQYNIESASRFLIPGFQGAPKYQGFYAELKEPMKGGFIGEAAYPTEDDIEKSKTKAEKDFKDFIDSYLSLQLPQEFKFIDASRQFNILKEEVNVNTDEKGNFTIFMDGESSAIGFRENDLISLLEKLGQTNLGENLKIKNYQLEYGVGRADFQKGQISFSVNFKGVFEEPINADDFKQKVLGKNEQDLKSLISSFSNIQKTTVSFWPFWVETVPDNLKRVNIDVE